MVRSDKSAKGTHCCICVATLNTFMLQQNLRQLQKWNLLLRFHGNSGYANAVAL